MTPWLDSHSVQYSFLSTHRHRTTIRHLSSARLQRLIYYHTTCRRHRQLQLEQGLPVNNFEF